MRPPRSYLPSLAQSGSWKVGRAIVSTPIWWTGPLTWSGFRRTERLATFPQVPDLSTMAVLPDGRAVLPVRAFSELRLMVVQKGKDPAPLVNTTEETAAPVAACGSREVAFMMGPEPHESIAFAEPATGRVVRTIAPGKGPVDSISCSPDGKTVYFSARGMVYY